MDNDIKWVQIPGYVGLYSVSENGDIFSDLRYITSGMGGQRKVGGFKKVNKNGEYNTVKLSKNGVKKRFFIHTLVCMSFHSSSYFIGAVVNHKDGNKRNNHVSNLEWVTIGYNQKHAYDNFLRSKIIGVNASTAKLNDEKVKEIRIIRDSTNMSYDKIADKYNVTKRTIILACKKITWSHVN